MWSKDKKLFLMPCLFAAFGICHRSHSPLCSLFQIPKPTKIQVKINQLILSPLLTKQSYVFPLNITIVSGLFLLAHIVQCRFGIAKKEQEGACRFPLPVLSFLFYRYFTSVAMTAPSVAVMEPRLMISLKVIRLHSFFIGTMISHPGKMSFADFTLVTVPFI